MLMIMKWAAHTGWVGEEIAAIASEEHAEMILKDRRLRFPGYQWRCVKVLDL